MNQNITDPHETETSSGDVTDSLTALTNQHWDRGQSTARARSEGIDLTDEHWAVIVFLHDFYLQQGLPINARTTARALNKEFSSQGGSKYLRGLFSGGPVTQGCRIANLRTPVYAIDPSFGTSY